MLLAKDQLSGPDRKGTAQNLRWGESSADINESKNRRKYACFFLFRQGFFFAKTSEQLVVNSAESTVGHDRDHVPVTHLTREMVDNGIRVRKGRRGLSCSRNIFDKFVDV